MANFTPGLLVSLGNLALSNKMENGIPFSSYWAFCIGACATIITILVTVFTTLEYPPTQEESERIKEAKKLKNHIRILKDIGIAIKEMPYATKQLISVIFFYWYAIFCYWQYLISTLSLSLYDNLAQSTTYFDQA